MKTLKVILSIVAISSVLGAADLSTETQTEILNIQNAKTTEARVKAMNEFKYSLSKMSPEEREASLTAFQEEKVNGMNVNKEQIQEQFQAKAGEGKSTAEGIRGSMNIEQSQMNTHMNEVKTHLSDMNSHLPTTDVTQVNVDTTTLNR